jgi:hypothetical protein
MVVGQNSWVKGMSSPAKVSAVKQKNQRLTFGSLKPTNKRGQDTFFRSDTTRLGALGFLLVSLLTPFLPGVRVALAGQPAQEPEAIKTQSATRGNTETPVPPPGKLVATIPIQQLSLKNLQKILGIKAPKLSNLTNPSYYQMTWMIHEKYNNASIEEIIALACHNGPANLYKYSKVYVAPADAIDEQSGTLEHWVKKHHLVISPNPSHPEQVCLKVFYVDDLNHGAWIKDQTSQVIFDPAQPPHFKVKSAKISYKAFNPPQEQKKLSLTIQESLQSNQPINETFMAKEFNLGKIHPLLKLNEMDVSKIISPIHRDIVQNYLERNRYLFSLIEERAQKDFRSSLNKEDEEMVLVFPQVELQTIYERSIDEIPLRLVTITICSQAPASITFEDTGTTTHGRLNQMFKESIQNYIEQKRRYRLENNQ